MSGYLFEVFSPSEYRRAFDKALAVLRDRRDQWDGLAFRGVSGAALGFPLALELGCPYVVVRKPTESCHSYLEAEGKYVDEGRFVFVDDFVQSGETYRAVEKALAKACAGKIVAGILYRDPFSDAVPKTSIPNWAGARVSPTLKAWHIGRGPL